MLRCAVGNPESGSASNRISGSPGTLTSQPPALLMKSLIAANFALRSARHAASRAVVSRCQHWRFRSRQVDSRRASGSALIFPEFEISATSVAEPIPRGLE
jgi:hypothetical protein